MFKSTIEIKAEKNILKAYYDALIPEAEKTERSEYKLDLKKDSLVIKVKAKDATAFRALMTSLTGLISIVDKSIKTIQGEKNG